MINGDKACLKLTHRWVAVPDLKDGWHRISARAGGWNNGPLSYDELMNLIIINTSGKFCFDKESIYFEEEKDAVIFRMYYSG